MWFRPVKQCKEKRCGQQYYSADVLLLKEREGSGKRDEVQSSGDVAWRKEAERKGGVSKDTALSFLRYMYVRRDFTTNDLTPPQKNTLWNRNGAPSPSFPSPLLPVRN